MRLLLIAAFASLLDAQQKSVEELFRLGVQHSQAGEVAKARGYLAEALRLAPKSVPILNNLGAVSLAAGQTAEAEKYFRAALSLAPGDLDTLYNLGLIELRKGRSMQALALLRKTAAGRPADLQTLQALLLAELESGQNAATLTAVLKLALPQPEYFLGLAAPLVEKGHDAAARQILEHAVSLWPNRPEFRHLLGEVHERTGNYKDAVESYQAAVHHSPGNDIYWLSLGYEFLLHRNFDAAEKVFVTAIERLPKSLRLQLGLASTYLAWARKDDAMSALRRAIELEPGDEAGYFVLGKALALEPDLIAHADAAWLDSALHAYHGLKPGDAFPLYLLALRRGPDAADLLHKALTIDPGFTDAHVELGSVRMAERSYKEAIAAFEKAIALDPGHAQAHFRLSQAWFRSGNAAKGQAAHAQFQKLEARRKEELLRRDKEIRRFILR